MNISIAKSTIQFKNPQIGQPTRAVEAHYKGRRITAYVNGKTEIFDFKANELPFDSDEDAMVTAIEMRLAE